MLADPRLWLFLSLYFFSGALVKGFFYLRRKKNLSRSLLFLAAALLSLTVLWLFSGALQFSASNRGLWVLVAAAVIAGGLMGVHAAFSLLPFIICFFISYKTDWSLKAPGGEKTKVLGTMTFYPSTEGQVFFDWTGNDNRIHTVRLEGDAAAVVVEKTLLPDYLFFLENQWNVTGWASRNLLPSDIPETDTPYFRHISEVINHGGSRITVNVKKEFPALIFNPPGFFTSYSYYVSEKNELNIIDRKIPVGISRR